MRRDDLYVFSIEAALAGMRRDGRDAPAGARPDVIDRTYRAIEEDAGKLAQHPLIGAAAARSRLGRAQTLEIALKIVFVRLPDAICDQKNLGRGCRDAQVAA